MQVEYGFDADFKAGEIENEIALPLTLRFALSKRLLLQLDIETIISQRREGERRLTGVGDTRPGFQVLVL